MDNSEVQKEALHSEVNPQNILNDDVTPEKKERYLQQIEGSKKEMERKEALLMETYTELVSQDASHLDKLYEKDPKLAEKIAKNFWYDSYQSAQTSFNEPEKSNNGLNEADLEVWYQKRRGKDEHEIALQNAEKKIASLPEEHQERAKLYFDMIAEWKVLTSTTAKDFVEMATLYVNKDKMKSDSLNEGLAMLWSTWMNSGTTTKSSKNKDNYVIRDGKVILLSND